MKEKMSFFILILVLIVSITAATIITKKLSKNVGEVSSNNSIEENITENVDNPESDVLVFEANNFELEVLQSEKKVLIDFYADWCIPCQKLSPIVDKFAEKHNEIKVVRINIDEQKEIANKFNIRSIPTLVVIETPDKNVQRSARNIEGVKALTVDTLNVYDLVKYTNLLITEDAVKKLEEVYR